jgi:hypothetical protein
LNKDYQKLLKELSALKQTGVGAAPTKEIEQLPADFAEHSRAADADAALDRIVASEPMTPLLDSNYVGATIKGQTDYNNCNTLPLATAGDDEVCDTSEGSLPPLSAAHIAGSSSSHSSVPERLPPPSLASERLPPPSLASASRVNHISFLFQTYSTAVQQNSSPRIRSPSDLQREITRCELLRDVTKEVKALSDQVRYPSTAHHVIRVYPSTAQHVIRVHLQHTM